MPGKPSNIPGNFREQFRLFICVLERTATFILAGGRGERLQPLTRDRAKPAVPFGDRRIIDFTLSNCVQSGMSHPFLLIQHHAESLQQHVRRWWLSQGSAVSPKAAPVCVPAQTTAPYLGTADALTQNIALMEGASEVVVLSADHIYELDYREMIQYHRDCGAAVTIASIVCPHSAAGQFGIMVVDDQWRVADFQEKPLHPKTLPGDPDSVLANMGIYVFDARVLVDALLQDAATKSSSHDIGKNLLPHLAATRNVYAFNFVNKDTGKPRYWRDVGTLDSYYATAMEWCSKDGSVISQKAYVHRTAEIVDSILMPGARVERGARVRRAILDENVSVPAGGRVGYGDAEDHQFKRTPNGIVVVPAGTTFAAAPHRELGRNVFGKSRAVNTSIDF